MLRTLIRERDEEKQRADEQKRRADEQARAEHEAIQGDELRVEILRLQLGLERYKKFLPSVH